MPAYELYLEQLRRGFFHDDEEHGREGEAKESGRQLQVLMDRSREVVSVNVL